MSENNYDRAGQASVEGDADRRFAAWPKPSHPQVSLQHASARVGAICVVAVMATAGVLSGRSVDSRAASYFADGIRSRGCDTGILIAANDVTGTQQRPSATRFVTAVHNMRDGIKVLVMTLEELREITSVEAFTKLLQKSLKDLVSSGSIARC